MAQSLRRLAGRQYLSSTIAAATATTLLAAATYPSKKGDAKGDISFVGSDDVVIPRHHYFHSSTLFAYPRNSITSCEAPHPSLHPTISYKPSDPAEPAADPVGGVDVTTSDGRKVHVSGGMWGADQEGLVGRRKVGVSYSHHLITNFRCSWSFYSIMVCFLGGNCGGPLASIRCGRIIGMAGILHPLHLWQKREMITEWRPSNERDIFVKKA